MGLALSQEEVGRPNNPGTSVDGGSEPKNGDSGEESHTIEVLPSSWSFTDFISLKSKSSLGREDIEDSFYVVDVGRIIDLYDSWMETLPNVNPYYAVKCNSDPMLLKVLASLGVGFDCASKKEIKTVLDLGVGPDRVVYSMPDKQISYLQYAALHNVSLMSLDSEDELIKIKKHYPSAQLLLRLKVSRIYDENLESSSKFGCYVSSSKHLLDVAKSLGLNVVGVSYHAGLGHCDTAAYSKFYDRFLALLRDISDLFEYAAKIGYSFTLLDIGGGFHGNKYFQTEFRKVAATISLHILEFTKRFQNVRVIAEPGHYFACSPYILAACVINRKKADDGSDMYITTNGMYNSFSSLWVFPSIVHHPKLLKDEHQNSDDKKVYKCTIWGPVCCLDKVADGLYLPKLKLGDWLYYEDMGAYSLSLTADFNGFPKPVTYYFIKENHKHRIQPGFILCQAHETH